MKLSPNFDSTEFTCKCGCGFNDVSPKLISLLEQIRHRAGEKTLTVTSGCRCKTYNAKVGGKPKSQHLLGKAADIQHRSLIPKQLYTLIQDAHDKGVIFVGGMGLYKTFVHIDVRDNVARW